MAVVGVALGDRKMASYVRPEPSSGLKVNSSYFSPSKNSCLVGEAEREREREA